MATKKQMNKSQDAEIVRKLCVMWCNLNRWGDPNTGRKSTYWTSEKIFGAMKIIESVVPKKMLLKEWLKDK